MIAREILANYNTDEDYKGWIDQITAEGRNYESPLGVKPSANNGQPSAQQTANAYMLMKQRRPMVMEFYKKNTTTGVVELKSMTMYINPDKMSISNQKTIGKVQTRGGIFYHFWGDDHSNMAISGTTGLAGMAGIKQLEEVYFASGSLLRYNNYTPTQLYGNVGDFSTLNYSDPLEVVDKVSNSNYSSKMIDDIKDRLWSYSNGNSTGAINENQIYNCLNYLDIYKGNTELDNFIENDLLEIYNEVTSWDQTNLQVNYSRFYQKLLSLLGAKLPNMDDNIKVNIAYELSLQKIYSNLPVLERQTLIDQTQKDTLSTMVTFQQDRKAALKSYISSLKDFERRDKNIRDMLRNGLINIQSEMTDEWLPRQITIYFENRAYIGHFENFNYNRDAASNLILYDMRFVITKQYEFNNDTGASDAISDPITTSTLSSANNSIDIQYLHSMAAAPESKPDKNLYTMVPGDTLQSVANKFYGNSDYWPDIYAANLSEIENPDIMYPGQQFIIPTLPSGYRTWVVLQDDSLPKIARRFYGDGTKWKSISDANRDIISNVDILNPKQILKIPI